MSQSILITDLDNAWAAIKSWLQASETAIIAFIKQAWTIDSQMAIADLQSDLVTFGQSVQNDAPGTSAKTLGTQLLASVETQFAAQAGAMAWEDVLLAVSLATKQLNPPQTTGNAGVLPGGVQSS